VDFLEARNLWLLRLVHRPDVCLLSLRHAPRLGGYESDLTPVHEDIARTMGRSSFQIFGEVVLPQLRRSITSGSLLVALYAFSDFGAVAAMRHEVFTWVIYGAYRAGFNPTRAASLSIVLVLAALALTYAESVTRGRDDSSKKGTTARRRRSNTSWPLAILTSIGSLAIVIPGVVIPVANIASWLGRSSSRSIDWAISVGCDRTVVPQRQCHSNRHVATRTTCCVECSTLSQGNLRIIPERLTYITHALPGIVVAISVVYVGIRVARPWYQEFPLLIFGQVIIFLPVMVASLRAAFEKTPVALEEVAHSLGVGRISTLASCCASHCTPREFSLAQHSPCLLQ
jgi:iron(III) transport system permease protein